MLGYTTKNACLTRMDIIAMTTGLTGGIDDILPFIKPPLSALGSEQIHLQIFITKKITIFLTGQLH
jgi:hypothetical protein